MMSNERVLQIHMYLTSAFLRTFAVSQGSEDKVHNSKYQQFLVTNGFQNRQH